MPFNLPIEDEPKEMFHKRPKYVIKVIGVGGAGNNAIERMVRLGVSDVDLIAANTDVQVLESSNAKFKLQLGKELTRGLGAGGNPEKGEKAAEESIDEIREIIQGTDLLFITAGFGGGTGTGASPVIARIARELGILTVAVVTIPFHFEGSTKQKIANSGLNKLKPYVDTLIKISNDKLLEDNDDIPIRQAFAKADDILYQGITGISDLITKKGLVNTDFADVESVLKRRGSAMLGIGWGKGSNKAEEAAKNALNSKFLENSVQNATAALVNVSGKNPTLKDLKIVTSILHSYSTDEVNLKYGITEVADMQPDELKVTIVAAGYNKILNDFDGENIYEIPAIYRLFGNNVLNEEKIKLEKYLEAQQGDYEE